MLSSCKTCRTFCPQTFMKPIASSKHSWVTSFLFSTSLTARDRLGIYLQWHIWHKGLIISRATFLLSFNHGSLYVAHSWLLVSRHATMALLHELEIQARVLKIKHLMFLLTELNLLGKEDIKTIQWNCNVSRRAGKETIRIVALLSRRLCSPVEASMAFCKESSICNFPRYKTGKISFSRQLYLGSSRRENGAFSSG